MHRSMRMCLRKQFQVKSHMAAADILYTKKLYVYLHTLSELCLRMHSAKLQNCPHLYTALLKIEKKTWQW